MEWKVMPEVINIYAESIVVELRFRVKELILLKTALDHAEIGYSEKEDDGSKEAAEYITKEFYKMLEAALKETGYEPGRE
jgi:hypothetical protein